MAAIFGNYRGFFVNPNTRVVERLDKQPSSLLAEMATIEQNNATHARDEKLAAWLKWHKISFLLDIGCDFGSLLNECQKIGIDALGYDNDSTALEFVASANLRGSNVSIQDIIMAGNLLLPSDILTQHNKKLIAVSCLNILHSGNMDHELRKNLLSIFLSDADLVVVTLTKRLLKQLRSELHFKVIGFVGGTQKPISDTFAQLNQYGTTFRFTRFLHRLEKKFWETLYDKYDYSLPSRSYSRLVVILQPHHYSVE